VYLDAEDLEFHIVSLFNKQWQFEAGAIEVSGTGNKEELCIHSKGLPAYWGVTFERVLVVQAFTRNIAHYKTRSTSWEMNAKGF